MTREICREENFFVSRQLLKHSGETPGVIKSGLDSKTGSTNGDGVAGASRALLQKLEMFFARVTSKW
jgi:hypothetical protein